MASIASLATLVGNVLSAGGDPIAQALLAWPGLCMVGACHRLVRSIEAAPAAKDVSAAMSAVKTGDQPVSAATPELPADATDPHVRCGRTRPPARDRVRRLLRTHPDVSAEEVARCCEVTVRRARRLLAEERDPGGLVVLQEAAEA